MRKELSNLLRVLLCGDDASSTTAVAEQLAETPGGEHLRIAVVDTSDPKRSTHDIAREALVSDVAVIAVDGARGVTPENRRQTHLLLALGARRVVIAISDVDVTHAEAAWRGFERDWADLSARFGSTAVSWVPVSAGGDGKSTLLEHVESVGAIESMPGARLVDLTADRFEASVVWLSDRPLLQSRLYVMRIGVTTMSATVAPLKYRVDPRTFQPTPAKTLDCGDIGVCNLELTQAIAFDANRRRFELLDDSGTETVGVGLLHFALRRSQNVQWQELDIHKSARAALMGQRPCVVWFTGLSGAGKSTIANLVEKRLHALGRHTYLLDGDNVRHGLNKDLGFTDADRVENIRRVAEVARLMVDAGLVVLASFISPFRAERRMARALVGEGEFIEVFVDAPLEVVESRDPKGLYRKARRGELKNFTGVDSPYEAPENADVRLDTARLSAEESAQAVPTISSVPES